MHRSRSAQIAITFNWIYIMIAGGVILLFFVGIVVKQKAKSEQTLSTDILEILEGIFTGASISDDTINHLPAAGLRDYTFFFRCDDEYSEYGIEGLSNPIEDRITPIFSPLEIKTDEFILWSVPYHLPYKIIDMLMVSSKQTKYLILESTDPFIFEFMKLTAEEFNIKQVPNFDDAQIGGNHHLRLVYMDGQFDNVLPSGLIGLDPGSVSAIVFVGNQVTFYSNLDNSWEKGLTLPVIAMNEDRPAAKYAAIFSGNGEIYECNMKKAMRRAKYVGGIYEQKFNEIVTYHNKPTDSCNTIVASGNTLTTAHVGEAGVCGSGLKGCEQILQTTLELQTFNQKLRQNSCIQLY
jgi:hypothetical protein